MSIFPSVVFILRLIVGTIFLIAGAVKLKSGSSQFLSDIMGYELVPKPVAVVLATLLPWLEVVVGGLFLFGLWSQFSSITGAILLMIFSSSIAISLLRGKDNDCGCYRTLTPVKWRLVYRNLFLMGLLIPIYLMQGGLWSLDNRIFDRSDWQIILTKDVVALISLWAFALFSVLLLHKFTKLTSHVRNT